LFVAVTCLYGTLTYVPCYSFDELVAAGGFAANFVGVMKTGKDDVIVETCELIVDAYRDFG